MRIKLAVLLMVVVLTSVAYCVTSDESRVRTDVEARMDRVADHVKEQAAKWEASNSGAFDESLGLRTHKDYLALVEAAWRSKDAKHARLYREALIDELKSPRPERRALACALLGEGLDVAAIPEIGKLLDDNAPALPRVTSPYLLRQVLTPAGETSSIKVAAVSEFASTSLCMLTDESFSLRSDFEQWWQKNSDYKNTAWYWRKLWSPGVTAAKRMTDLSSLPDDTVLRVMLTPGIHWDGDSYKQLSKFLAKRHLSSRVMEMLMQKNLLPEINSQDSFESFVYRVKDLSPYIFTVKDEPLIAKAQSVTSPYKPPVADLVLIRAAITFPSAGPDKRVRVLPLTEKDRPVAILSEALRKDPTMVRIALELYDISGLRKADLVKRSFEAVSVYEKKMISEDVARNAQWANAAFIRELVELIPEPNASNYCDGGLGYLCRAANSVLKKQIISEQEISSVELSPGKTTPREDFERSAACFSEVRKKLLKALED